MGRPLNKKYFGNRNVGSTSTTADNKIGGEGVASVSQPGGGVGSFVISDTYRNFPTLTAAAPTIPGGVTALLSPVFEIATVTFSSGGQTNADYVPGLSTSIVGLGGGAIVNITEVASKVTAVDVTTAGTNRGEFRRGDITGIGITTFQVLQAPNAGTDLQINITFRVKRIEVTEQGSGYVSVPALTWGGHTFTGQTAPSLNVVTLTVDTGNVGSSTYEENAILMTARLTGGSATTVDIIRQVSTNRFKVTDGTRTGIVKLKSSVATAAGEGSVRLLDTDGGTYFATKITARKATITRGTGLQAAFVTGTAVKWNMTAATASSLLIDNA
jgi:hypothetical protein